MTTLNNAVRGGGGGGVSGLQFSRAVLDAYRQQIGGRGHRHHNDQILRLRHTERLLKPLPDDARGDRELKFYRDKNSGFHCFVPTFFGEASVSETDTVFLCMEDVLAPLQGRVSICDIKLGRKTFGPDASADKIEKETSSYRYQEQLGFRFVGLRVFSLESTKLLVKDKPYGKSLEPEQIPEAWKLFLSGSAVPKRVIEKLIVKLGEIYEFMEVQRRYHIFASSLLLAYDTNQDVVVKMIDFGHAFAVDHPCVDENYLFGLNNLRSSLEKLLQ